MYEQVCTFMLSKHHIVTCSVFRKDVISSQNVKVLYTGIMHKHMRFYLHGKGGLMNIEIKAIKNANGS